MVLQAYTVPTSAATWQISLLRYATDRTFVVFTTTSMIMPAA